MGKYSCAIGGCPEKSYAKSPGVKFFYLATLTDENVKNAWKDKILSTRADISNRNQINDVAICSRHFVDGDKRNLPTIIPKVNSKKEVIWPEQKTRRTIIRKLPVRSFTGMDRNGSDYRNGLPEWTFICVLGYFSFCLLEHICLERTQTGFSSRIL